MSNDSTIAASTTQSVLPGQTKKGYVIFGTQVVSSGGTASASVVSSGGLINVKPGGAAKSVKVNINGSSIISKTGTDTSGAIAKKGYQTVYGTAYQTTIAGTQFIAGGIASSAVVNTSGWQELTGGKTFATTLKSGVQNVLGGVANGTIITGGGVQMLSETGTAKLTQISAGGTQFVWAGGSANGDTIFSKGVQNIGSFGSEGGVAVSVIASKGGVQNLYSGEATGTILRGGTQNVYYGNASKAQVSNGGRQFVLSGVASHTYVSAGGTQTVSANGMAENNHILNKGVAIVYGSADAAAIANGGVMRISGYGASADNTKINAGGTLETASGAVTVNTVASAATSAASGGTDAVNVSGVSSDAKIFGRQIVKGRAYNASICANGVQAVRASGAAMDTQVLSGGTAAVSKGGSASGTMVSAGGTAVVYSGGRDYSAFLEGKGARHIVKLSGGAVGAIIESGGTQTVYGNALETQIFEKGSAVVGSGGVATGALVGSGGQLRVASAGKALGGSASGEVYVFNKGIVSGMLLSDGGHLWLGSSTTIKPAASGGSATVSITLGGSASGVAVADGARVDVLKGGRSVFGYISGTMVVNGGLSKQVSMTAAACSSVKESVYEGGLQKAVNGGLVKSSIVQGGGSVCIAAYGFGSAISAAGNGAITVQNKGLAVGNRISGIETVEGGGKSVSARILAQGVQAVTGKSASSSIVNGKAEYTTVDVGGTAHIQVHGIGINMAAVSGGTIAVDKGGVLSNGRIRGSLYVNGTAKAVISSGIPRIDPAGLVIMAGGSLLVDSTGLALSHTVFLNGAETVASDGKTSAAKIYGRQTVMSGAFMYAASALSGGVIDIYGTAAGAVVSASGAMNVNSDATAKNTVIKAGGNEYVNSGAKDIAASAAGFQTVSSGGTASLTIIQKGGKQNVYGTAISGQIIAGGTAFAMSGGMLSAMTISAGGVECISGSGLSVAAKIFGSASNAPVSSGNSSGTKVVIVSGRQAVLSDGLASGASVFSGGLQNVGAGGRSSKTILCSGGSASVKGTAELTEVRAGGIETVAKGGLSISAKVTGLQSVAGGKTSGAIILNKGAQNLAGEAFDTVVSAGGTVNVKTSGVNSGAVVFRSTSAAGVENVIDGGLSLSSFIYGLQNVSSGIASAATLFKQGRQIAGCRIAKASGSSGSSTVRFRASAVETVVQSGGKLEVSGGGAWNATVNSGGSEVVYESGLSVSSFIGSGAVQVVRTGGSAQFASIGSEGSQKVSAKGLSLSAAVKAGKVEVYSGGIASKAELDGDDSNLLVYAGGKALGVETQRGAGVHVKPGGYASGGTAYNSGYVAITASGGAIGKANGMTAGNNGYITVSSGGAAVNSIIEAQGSQYVKLGADATGTQIDADGTEVVESGGRSSKASIYGEQLVVKGGLTVDAGVCNAGLLRLNGSASGVSVSSGGELLIQSDGLATATAVKVGGEEIVSSGGTSTKAKINGTQTVFSGGSSLNASINSASYAGVSGYIKKVAVEGELHVFKTGLAEYVTVNNKGVLEQEGSLTSATVNKGGTAEIYARDGVSAITVASGGVLNVNAYAAVNGITANKGAVVNADATASVSGVAISAGATLFCSSGTEIGGVNAFTGGAASGGYSGGYVVATSGASVGVAGAAMSALYLRLNGAKLGGSGATTVIGGLSMNDEATIACSISGMKGNNSAILRLATNNSQDIGNYILHVGSKQALGTYALLDGFSQSGGMIWTVYVDSSTDSLGTTKANDQSGTQTWKLEDKKNGVVYNVETTGTGVNVTLKAIKSSTPIVTGNASNDVSISIDASGDASAPAGQTAVLQGTKNGEVFFGRAGSNDAIKGVNGRDCAVYGAEDWGQDVIKATKGTMTLVFNGLKSGDVVKSLSGTTMTISKKSDASQSVAIEGWDAGGTHDLVFAPAGLKAFNAWAKAASPASVQAEAARNEVWKAAKLA